MTSRLTRAALLAAFLVGLPASAAADERVDRLSEEHKTWLERDVVYIITEQERDVFLSLETVEERNRFIEAFWKKRDPNRTTPENEFKTEHYRRIEYANTHLGRETYLEGWRTDRGRYYIILGEPREIQRFEGYGQIVSTHLWFYQGDPELGLPSFFYLLFFKRNDFGEFRLYSPAIDGPKSLVTGGAGPAAYDDVAAVAELHDISPELAAASLSFDTSDPPDLATARPSMTSDLLIARIEESPKRAIRTDYAEAALRYGSRVSAEYTFNFVPSRSTFALLADPSGMAIVQYSIEIDPENFATESDEAQTKFYTTLDLTIEARNIDGVLIFEENKEVYLELTPSRMREVQSRPFAYQDQFPLVAGDYTVSIILRNRVLSRYTVAEADLHVPELSSAEPELTDIILAYETSLGSGAVDERSVRTFQIGDLRVQPAAGNLFVLGDTVHVLTQAFGASPAHSVVFELVNGDEILKSVTSSVSENGVVLDAMRLDDIVGGDYRVRARLLSPAGESLSVKSAPLAVSPRSTAPRPGFVYRRGFDTRAPGMLSAIRGEQLWKAGRHQESRVALEAAIAANPRHVGARVMLGTIHLRDGDGNRAFELLKPVEEVLPDQYEVVSGIGFATYLKGEYQTAVDYLERARTLRPPEPLLLNALADSHERLGNVEKARETYERSLKLDGEQTEVKARLAALRAAGVKN